MKELLPFLNAFTPEVVWGLFPRLLGVVYIIAIGSLYKQALPIAGSKGLRPIKLQLEKIKLDYPGYKRFLYFPTLLWFNAEDWFLKGLILVACGSAALVIFGGALSWLCLLICWVIFLSLDIPIGLTFPWDSLLLEAGFLAIFLPPINTLPTLTTTALPFPVLAVAFHLLLFRLMFGFGKFKFTGTHIKEQLYLKAFLINQPMPSPLGWLAARLPNWTLITGLVCLFFIEIILPFFVFIPGDLRIIAALGITGLMFNIQITSNFGYFNMLVIAMCVTLLDSQVSIFSQSLAGIFASWNALLFHAMMLVLFMGALIYFPFNSWCNQSWMYWPSIAQVRTKWIKHLIAFYRLLSPFRVVNAYGVFPPISTPGMKWVALVEGSNDGKEWKAYHYQYMPSSPSSPPRFIAPYHPRLDHSVFYEVFGTNTSYFLKSTFNCNTPYTFSRFSSMDRVVQRLLEGSKPVASLFSHNPFPDAPPKLIRVSTYMLEPTTPAEQKRTGNWWHLTYVGPHLAPATLDSTLLTELDPDPELFHWDDIIWKERAPRLKAMMNLARSNLDATSILQQTGRGITAQDIELFWNDFIPCVGQADPANWQLLPSFVQMLQDRYGKKQLEVFERLFASLSLILWAKLEPYYLGDAAPKLEVESYFHAGLLAHYIIARGQKTYDAVLSHPESAVSFASEMTTPTGLFYLGIFWFDAMLFYARKFRLLNQWNTLSYARGLPGFTEAMPFLAEQFYSPDKETIPVFVRSVSNGEWLIVDEQRPRLIPALSN